MQMTKKQAEFWVALLVLCIIVAVAVLLVDFGIKAAILEESNKLRLTIEGIERGQSAGGAAQDRADNNTSNDATISSDVLVGDTPGMEAGSADNPATVNGQSQATRRPKPRRPARNREVQSGD